MPAHPLTADAAPVTASFPSTTDVPVPVPLPPLTPDSRPPSGLDAPTGRKLTPVSASIEAEIISLFVDLMRCFGAPKSLGAIYGLLFVSDKPLPFEQIMTRLQLSSGSVSQGLRLLKELGAATVVFVPGDRRDHYTAETRLRQLAAGFLRRRVAAEFTNAGERLSRVVDQFATPQPADAASHAFLAERVAILARWQNQARQLLPVALAALSAEAQQPQEDRR